MLVSGHSRVGEICVMLLSEHQFLLSIVIYNVMEFSHLVCHWLRTPVGSTVLPEDLTLIFRKVGDVEGTLCAELERETGGGHYQGNIRKPWWRLLADLIQPPKASKQMAGRCC